MNEAHAPPTGLNTVFYEPLPELSQRVADVMKQRPVTWSRIEGRGYTAALRLVVGFENGTSAFVKAATSEQTAEWLRQEKRVYESLETQSFLPVLHGHGDDGSAGAFPFLILEDLSACTWPPPWNQKQIKAVQDTLAQIAGWRGTLLNDLPGVETQTTKSGWERVAADPGPFLSLELCSPQWLTRHLAVLTEAAASAPFTGNDLLHLDVRSDNLCFRPDGTAVLVDWNWACRGNAEADVACWLPSLTVEGGPLPDTVLPRAPGFAAWLAGFWAASAGLPPPPGASARLRSQQQKQLAVALSWATRALGLH